MAYKVTYKNVLEAINKAERLDGRGVFEHRDVQIKFDVSNKSEGSVSVKFGKTEVVAGIKMDVAEPYTDHENEGTMMVSMDLLPLSSPNFEYGAPTIDSIEIARVVDRGIRESGFIDFKKLCIKEGEKVWCVFIDLATINDDGNLIDASAFAAILALLIAKIPKYNEETEKADYGESTDKGLPLDENKMPLTTTFFKIGDKVFIDPTREEEDVAEGRVTIEVSGAGKDAMVNAMQKGGEATLTQEDVGIAVEEAVKMFKKLKTIIDEEVEKAEKEHKSEKKKK